MIGSIRGKIILNVMNQSHVILANQKVAMVVEYNSHPLMIQKNILLMNVLTVMVMYTILVCGSTQ